MASAHPIKNTTKPYNCTNCGSDHVSVIREDPKGINPRVKCNACQFMFDGQDALAALEAGAIQPSSPDTLASASEPEIERLEPRIAKDGLRKILPDFPTNNVYPPEQMSIPDRPAYVFLSKPRGLIEFCSKRDFKRTAVKWHDTNYDVYELKPLKLSVDIKVVS